MLGQSVRVPFRSRYRTSRAIFGQAWTLLRSERDLLRFPLMAGGLFLTMLAAILLAAVVGFRVAELDGLVPWLRPYVLVPVMIVLTVPVGFLGALLNCAYGFGLHERLHGRACTPRQAWARAVQHRGTILRFSLIAALVSGLFALVGQLLDKLRLVPWLGGLLQAVGAYAWAVAAFFVVPIIVVEREASAREAIRKSVAMARETWGRSTAGIVTISLALLVPMMAVMVVAFVVLGAFMAAAFSTGQVALVFIGTSVAIGILVLALGAMMVASQAATTAYQVALYSVTRTGIVPLPFTPETLVDAWAPYRK